MSYGHARALGTPLLHDPPVFGRETATIEIGSNCGILEQCIGGLFAALRDGDDAAGKKAKLFTMLRMERALSLPLDIATPSH